MNESWDLIVIGSGASGGWVAKEAAERGAKVLMLEAGRRLDPTRDFPEPDHEGGSRVSILTRVMAILKGQQVQARCMSYTPQTAHLFLNDRQNPYTTGQGRAVQLVSRAAGRRAAAPLGAECLAHLGPRPQGRRA